MSHGAIWVIAVGFVLGLRHASDADHIAAMSTIVSRCRRFGASWLLGACWGLGHTLTLFAAGAAIVSLRLAVEPRWEAALEFAVGVMLTILGIVNLRGGMARRLGVREHSHEHAHPGAHHHHLFGGEGAVVHAHAHPHSAALEALGPGVDLGRALKSFGIGLVHGLAGSSAIALLVLAAIPDAATALAYLAVFGLGTLAGMMALSTLMEFAMVWSVRRWRVERWLVSGAGAVSLALGLYIMYRNGSEMW